MNQKRNSIIGHEWDVRAGYITFTVAGAGTCQVNVGALSEEVRTHAMFHGLTQRVQDKAAISRNPDTGRSATPQDKLAAMQALCEHLNNGGVWEMRAASKARLDRAALFEAVAEVSGREASVIEARFRDREDSVLRVMLERADIAAAYAKRTARDSGQADALLAELEG